MMTGWRTKIRRQMNERDTVRAILTLFFGSPLSLPLTRFFSACICSSLEESSPTVRLLCSSDLPFRFLTAFSFLLVALSTVLMGWETVKICNAEERENSRYRAAIAEYQGTFFLFPPGRFPLVLQLAHRCCSLPLVQTVLEFKVVGSLNLLNLTQNTIISVGKLAFPTKDPSPRTAASSFLLLPPFTSLDSLGPYFLSFLFSR